MFAPRQNTTSAIMILIAKPVLKRRIIATIQKDKIENEYAHH
jgi:hypothetical protein